MAARFFSGSWLVWEFKSQSHFLNANVDGNFMFKHPHGSLLHFKWSFLHFVQLQIYKCIYMLLQSFTTHLSPLFPQLLHSVCIFQSPAI